MRAVLPRFFHITSNFFWNYGTESGADQRKTFFTWKITHTDRTSRTFNFIHVRIFFDGFVPASNVNAWTTQSSTSDQTHQTCWTQCHQIVTSNLQSLLTEHTTLDIRHSAWWGTLEGASMGHDDRRHFFFFSTLPITTTHTTAPEKILAEQTHLNKCLKSKKIIRAIFPLLKKSIFSSLFPTSNESNTVIKHNKHIKHHKHIKHMWSRNNKKSVYAFWAPGMEWSVWGVGGVCVWWKYFWRCVCGCVCRLPKQPTTCMQNARVVGVNSSQSEALPSRTVHYVPEPSEFFQKLKKWK